MTDENITEAFSLIRHHSSPLTHPLIASVERAWRLDRELLVLRDHQLDMLAGVTDNKRWSRRAGLRAVDS